MGPGDNCGNCKYGVVVQKPRSTQVICRRFPARPTLLRGETFEPGDTLQGFWPRVDPADVCGEHMLKV